jgi:hypothetical protein
MLLSVNNPKKLQFKLIWNKILVSHQFDPENSYKSSQLSTFQKSKKPKIAVIKNDPKTKRQGSVCKGAAGN